MYDALRYISKYYTVTNGSAVFETQQVRIPHNKVYYLCRHILTISFDFIKILLIVLNMLMMIYGLVPFTLCMRTLNKIGIFE